MKFRRMSEKDYAKEATRLLEATDAYAAFEKADEDSKALKFATSYLNARYYFGLSHYVINDIFAGSRLSNIYKLLGLTQEQAKGITEFTLCYSSERGLEPSSVDIMSDKDTYIGGDAVYHMIQDLTQEMIDEYLLSILSNAYNNNKISEYRNIDFTTIKPSNGVEVVYGVWVDLGDLPSYDGLADDISECIFAGGKSLASRAYALWMRGLEDYKEFLMCCISKHVMLMPRSMRTVRHKGNMKQYDPLDTLYKNCYNANLILSRIYAAAENYSNYIAAYKRLQSCFTSLVSKRATDDKKRKSLMARLSTKTGQIRGTNLGKRLDYSGRSVIVVNPFMSLKNIGLPKRVIPQLYAHDIFDSMSKDMDAKITPDTWVQQHGETMRDTGNEYVRQHSEILSRAPIPIGRQPTLHKGSITAYYPIPTDNNAVELSPLVCPPFNADFDGDTMWYMNNLSDKAKREATELLFGVKNPFWAKNGAPTMIPRQEIIYGLNTCTAPGFIRYESAINVTPEDAYKLIVTNSKPVNATGCYTDATGRREYDTLGRLAFDYCIKDIVGLMKFKDKNSIRRKYVYMCPICLSTIIKDSELSGSDGRCPTHERVDMRLVREFDVVHCRMCGKDSSAIAIGLNKNTSNDEELQKRITEFASNVRVNEPLYSEASNLYSALLAIFNYRETDATHFALTLSYINNFIDRSDAEVQEQLAKGTLEASIEVGKNICSTTEEAVSKLGPISYSFWEALRRLPVPTVRELLKNIPESRHVILSNENILHPVLFKYLRKFDAMLDEFRRRVDIYTPCEISASDLTAITRRCPACSTVTSKNIASIVNRLLVKSTAAGHLGDNTDIFTESVDKLVKLGFVVAKYYAPSLDILTDINQNSTEFQEAESRFNTTIAQLDEYYDYGFMEDSTYNSAYQDALTKYGKSVEDGIPKALGESNGFLRMVQSGARGSTSNLVQIYGFKGQVVKNSTESFNAIIDSCYAKQLSPFQHFLSTYGARRGIMDRSLETANTGYASRQLWHAMQSMVITCDDCGTDEGITIRRSHVGIIDPSNSGARDKENEWLVKLLTGRCRVNSTQPMTRTEATAWVEDGYTEEFTVRSPITCNNPCCKACYGIDLSTHDEVVKGTPIGIVGAQGIGETTSQLTMRTFQGGGVAKKGGIGSAFDSFETYVSLRDTHTTGNYEPTAWKSGYVLAKEYSKDTSKYMVTISDESDVVTRDTDWSKRTYVLVDKDVKLRHYVEAGDGFYVESGDQYIPEIVAASDVYKAGLYLSLKLFSIFRTECEINLKHFETLAACMTRALVLKTNNPYLNTGCTYSRNELNYNYFSGYHTSVRWGFYKVIDIPSLSSSAVANIDFESVSEGLTNIMAYGRSESFEDPIENIVFGRAPIVGSELNPHYVEERSNFVVREDMI